MSDFDRVIDRRGTHATKWDMTAKLSGITAADAIPMWVADMDFAAPPGVTQALAATVDGVSPTLATISDGSYPLSRSLYIYVKKANIGVTPGLREFVNAFVSDAATGKGGYLQQRGLIPLAPDAHAAQKEAATALASMAAPAK